MTRMVGGILRGSWAGVVATLFMSAVMLGAGRLGLMGEQPPERIGGRILGRLDPFHSEEERDVAGSALHLAIGAGLGVVFGLLRRFAPGMRLPGTGVIYALGVWAASYAGVLPAVGLMPPPHRDRPGRPVAMIAAHVVFGIVLGRLMRPGRRGDMAQAAADKG